MMMKPSVLVSFILGVALFLASASTSFAYEETKGVTRVEAVDTTNQTMTLQGISYAITPRTQLTGKEGERIPLSALVPPPPDRFGMTQLNTQNYVRFVAANIRGKQVLLSAQQTEKFEH